MWWIRQTGSKPPNKDSRHSFLLKGERSRRIGVRGCSAPHRRLSGTMSGGSAMGGEWVTSPLTPLPGRSLGLPTSLLGGGGAHDLIHSGVVVEALKATPEDGDTGRMGARACDVPAEARDPQDGVTQWRRGGRRDGCLVGDACQRRFEIPHFCRFQIPQITCSVLLMRGLVAMLRGDRPCVSRAGGSSLRG